MKGRRSDLSVILSERHGQDADGNIKITGKHTQCSDISDVLRKRMMENGISARELAAFTMKKEGANDVD